MNVLARLTLPGLARSYDGATLGRARTYAAEGAVSTPDLVRLEDREVEATAQVTGSGPTPYAVHLVARAEASPDGVSVRSSCSCPISSRCKHGAALALVLGSTFAGPAARDDWERDVSTLLEDLADLAPPEEALPGVALELTWVGPGARYGYRASRPQLRVRPLRPGARQAWVRSGLGWGDVTGALVRRTHDLAQLQALERLHAALSSQSSYWYAGLDPALDDFGPAVVELLVGARDAGVTFVPVAPLRQVELVTDPLALESDVSEVDGAVHVRVGVGHAGRLWSGDAVATIGAPAHSVALREGDDVVLAPLARRLTDGPVRALRRPDPVVIRAGATTEPAEAPEVAEVLRRLRRALLVTSRDGSVEVPEPEVPRLRVTLRWDTAARAEVSWDWRYGARVSFPIDQDAPPDVVRDRAAERDLLEAVTPAPTAARTEVGGVDVLHLGLLELPAWRAVPDLEVVELDAPDLRESQEAPQIAFEAASDAETQQPSTVPVADRPEDWLDLDVVLTVEGEQFPLADVLAAITLGHEHVVLPSGLFVRTDRPELDRLHELVRAAAELHEPEDDGQVRVARQDLGLWAQLADLGAVDARAAEWVRRAQALRDLVELPRPEPTGVVPTLRHYQLDGFHWLAFLWQHQLGGILADDMGLGKTLQVLTLVAHTRATTSAPFLVVAPTSVVSAWVGEAARHTPGLRVRAVTSSASRRRESIADLASGADVVVTTYTLLRLEEQAYAGVAWAGLVLDEAQQVKNHQSKSYAAVRAIDAPFRLAVTGTPFENRLLELWALLSIVAPGLYPRPRDFVDHVVRPVEKEGDAAALGRFTRRISPFLLRRTKDLVAADLPPKQEQVLEVVLGTAHRRLYDTHLAKERQRILGLVEDFDGNRVAILAALMKLRQLALDPALVDPDLRRVGSAKLDVLVDHLREVTAEGHRALVFSSFTGFLRRVRDRLDAESIATTYLDGTTTHRGEVVEEFRGGAAPVFLISLKAGGVGLTLTEADYVFVLDPWWNPAAEAQAIDRAHRIGQTSTVMVYRLVAADTVEEKVVALKDRKAALFAQVVDGATGLAEAITADDVRGLLDRARGDDAG